MKLLAAMAVLSLALAFRKTCQTRARDWCCSSRAVVSVIACECKIKEAGHGCGIGMNAIGIQIPNAQIPQATRVRKAPTASSSVPYSLSILSRLVRRSKSLTRLLGDTNLSSPPRFLAETESPARIPSPPLSM